MKRLIEIAPGEWLNPDHVVAVQDAGDGTAIVCLTQRLPAKSPKMGEIVYLSTRTVAEVVALINGDEDEPEPPRVVPISDATEEEMRMFAGLTKTVFLRHLNAKRILDKARVMTRPVLLEKLQEMGIQLPQTRYIPTILPRMCRFSVRSKKGGEGELYVSRTAMPEAK